MYPFRLGNLILIQTLHAGRQQQLIIIGAPDLMKKNSLNNSAFSLLEILLASIIFIVSVGGIFVTLNALRKPVADKESALTAAIFGKQVLEALRSNVDARTYYNCCTGVANCSGPTPPTCGDFSLALGPHQVALPPAGVPQITWPNTGLSQANGGYLNYNVFCADSTAAAPEYANCATGANPDMARQVNLNINWPDSP